MAQDSCGVAYFNPDSTITKFNCRIGARTNDETDVEYMLDYGTNPGPEPDGPWGGTDVAPERAPGPEEAATDEEWYREDRVREAEEADEPEAAPAIDPATVICPNPSPDPQIVGICRRRKEAED